jgi:hypothetical protein
VAGRWPVRVVNRRAVSLRVSGTSPAGVLAARSVVAVMQYALVERAAALGWARSRICVIDDDLGVSGHPRRGRDRARRDARDAPLGGHHRDTPGRRAAGHPGDARPLDIRVTRDYVHVSSPLAHDAAARVGRALFGVTVPKIVPKGSPQ